MARRAGLCVLVLLLAISCAAAAAGQPIPERPTPDVYEQWQPQKDSSDPRLDRPISAWEKEILLKDLLAQLSQQTSVPLSAVSDLALIPVTCFVKKDTLSGLMGTLSAVFDGYWVYPVGERGADRHYLFTTFQPPVELTEDYIWYLGLKLWEQREAPLRADREERLARHLEALAWKPEEVVARYASDDPWLCVAVLEPRSRSLLECLAGLSDESRDELLTYGRLDVPLARVPARFRPALRKWCDEDFEQLRRDMALDPLPPDRLDRAKRFADPEEAWKNAVLWFGWAHAQLSAQLRVPDAIGLPSAALMHQGAASTARTRLAQLGYGQPPTEEERRQDEAAERQAIVGGEASTSPIWLANDPRRDLPLHLSGLPKVPRANASLLFEQVASQAQLNALSMYQASPEGDARIGSLYAQTGVTLGALADAWQTHAPRGQTALKLRGTYLLALHQNYLGERAWVPPDETLARWRLKLAGRETMSLEELATLAADLSLAQASSLRRRTEADFDALGVRIDRLRLYGLLTDKQRARLRGERLSAASLDRRQVSALLFQARNQNRAWMTPDDLKGTVLTLRPQTLPSGKEVLCLIAEYHFSGLPVDRDVIFESPREVPVPEILRTKPAGG